VAIMVLNLIVMLAARRLAPVLAFVLPILGAVLGVVQVALGLQIINNALQMLGVL
jgi:multiple antibiotic resistance protein